MCLCSLSAVISGEQLHYLGKQCVSAASVMPLLENNYGSAACASLPSHVDRL